MTALILIITLTAAFAAIVRIAGGSRILAIAIGVLPVIAFQSVSFGPKIRTPEGGIVPGWQLFLGSFLIPAVVATIVSFVIKRKKAPNQPLQPTAPSRRG